MPLFGGVPGGFQLLAARPQPPARVYRVTPGRIWWTLLHWPWRQYQAAVAAGVAGVVPPRLAPPGAAGIYVTDRASLVGCDSPADFAWRLSLNAQAQQECLIYGCAVIRLDRPQPCVLAPLPPLPGAAAGLSGGGAREWLLAGNLDLTASMQVHCVEQTPYGPRHYRLPL
jgi:hypothetical protein